MEIEHDVINGIDVIELHENINLYSTPSIKKFLRSLLNSPDRKIIISMEKVIYIDSTGIGMLVGLFFESKQKNIQIRLTNLSTDARRILTVTKLLESYEIRENLEDAIKSFE